MGLWCNLTERVIVKIELELSIISADMIIYLFAVSSDLNRVALSKLITTIRTKL